MSPDSVLWLGRAWYTLPAISVKVRESLVQFPRDCTLSFHCCIARVQFTVYSLFTEKGVKYIRVGGKSVHQGAQGRKI